MRMLTAFVFLSLSMLTIDSIATPDNELCSPNNSVERPDVTVGDVYVMQRSLTESSRSASHITTLRRQVTSVNGDSILTSSVFTNFKHSKARLNRFTPEWNLISTTTPDGYNVNFTPPLNYFSFPLFPGKTWQQASLETNMKSGKSSNIVMTGKVGCWSTVSVPAGTFLAIQVETITNITDNTTGLHSAGRDISWYAPEVKRTVKTTSTSRKGQKDGSEYIQMLSFEGVRAKFLPQTNADQQINPSQQPSITLTPIPAQNPTLPVTPAAPAKSNPVAIIQPPATPPMSRAHEPTDHSISSRINDHVNLAFVVPLALLLLLLVFIKLNNKEQQSASSSYDAQQLGVARSKVSKSQKYKPAAPLEKRRR